tara:strand:+ start:1 stop:831 length:831 start_codon:yes stop_codon:yes gene_type:complete
MRIFGSESINNMLEKLGLKDGESIDHPWINKALERAQQKVEARNFDIRKSLLKFDNVLNDQRQVIFSQRKEVLRAKDVYVFVNKLLDDEVDQVIKEKNNSLNLEKDKVLRNKFETLLQSQNENYLNETLSLKQNEIINIIMTKFNDKRKQRIAILTEAGNNELERKIFLQIIDLNWKNHIQYLEQLRQVIGLRSYGQRDPLIEYKKETFTLFEKLLDKIRQDTILLLINLKIENTNKKIKQDKKIEVNKKKIGRNELCYCGSKKKFKHCCGSLSKL